MEINYGDGKTEFGPGVLINLTSEEVCTAIISYLTAHNIHIEGARTIKINNELCENSSIYVDPSGFVLNDGYKISGRGPEKFKGFIIC